MIIPRPKKFSRLSGAFPIRQGLQIVFAPAPHCREEAIHLRDELRSLCGFTPDVVSEHSGQRSGNIILRLRQDSSENSEEAYRIFVTSDSAVLEAWTDKGLFYAGQSLLGLLEKDKDGLCLPQCEIDDCPDFAWRGFLIDPARDFIPIPKIREYLDAMGRAKMNIIHLNFNDNEQYTLESKAYPQLNQRLFHHLLHRSPGAHNEPPYRRFPEPFTLKDVEKSAAKYGGFYTSSDIKEIVAYAQERKIQVVPHVSLLGHAGALVHAFPEIRCRIKEGIPAHGVVCAGSEETYRVIESLLDEVVPLFPGPVFHIGGDEIQNKVHALPEWRWLYHHSWDECSVCRERMEKEGLKNHYQLFYYAVRRIHAILARRGKRMMMWNDNIDIARPVEIPRDILIQFWRIAFPGCGPVKGCSLSKFLKAGFEVVNSYYPDTYMDGSLRDRRLAGWNPARKPVSPPECRNRIIGGEACAWCNWEFYPRTIPPALTMFANQIWNSGGIGPLEDFAMDVSRHIFGPHLPDELLPIYRWFGSVTSPGGYPYEESPGCNVSMPEYALKTRGEWESVMKSLKKAMKSPVISNQAALGECLNAISEIFPPEVK